MAPVVDVLPSTTWVDVTDRIRLESGLSIERGRPAEYDITNSVLEFVADNRDRWWSSDVPGTTNCRLLGRGTEIRVTDTIVEDTFTRTSVNSWGSTEDPELPWTNDGTASDYQVTGGVGRHILTSAAVARKSSLALSMRDVFIRFTVQVQALATGSAYRYAWRCRSKTGDVAHYRFELRFQTSGSVEAAVTRLGGPAEVDLDTATITGTYGASSILHGIFCVAGNQLMGKAWFDGSDEPYGWDVAAEDELFTFGTVGLTTLRDGSNSNANLQLDTLSVEIRENRFYGEIWSLTPMGDRSGRDLTMSVEAAGLFRRLSNTDKPIRSALYRSITTGSIDPVAYWPLEDGSLATQLEAYPDTVATGYFFGAVSLGSESALTGSASLPTVPTGGLLAGTIPKFASTFNAATDEWALTFLMKIDAPPEEESVIARFGTSTAAACYELAMDPDGNLIFRTPKLFDLLLNVYAFEESNTYNSTFFDDVRFGKWVTVTMFNTPVGGANYQVHIQWTTADTNGSIDGISSPLGSTVWREPNGSWQCFGPPSGTRGFGHVAAWDQLNSLTGASEVTGYVGELGRTRYSRLAAEEGLAINTLGLGSVRMGPQPVDTLLAAMEDAANTDLGVAYEPRYGLGPEYRAHTHLFNQLPVATIDLAARQLASGLAPIRDDGQGLANRVVAVRTGGTPQTATIVDGDVHHLTTETPPAGIGLMQASISPNVEDDLDAAAQAGWHVHLRATRDARFDALEIPLHARAYRETPQLAANIGSIELGNAIALDNQPSWMDPNPIYLIVQGVKEYTRRNKDRQIERTITLNCTPAVPWEVWCLDTSGSTVAVSATSGAMTLRVATSAGPEWVTAPDPAFLIQVAGEGMRVTGCTTDTPSYVGVGTASHADNATVAPALPASLQTGDLMIAVAAIRNTAASVATPAGWTVLSSAYNAFRIYGRYYVSGDSAPSFTFSGGSAGDTTSAFVSAFRNLSLEDSDARYGKTTDSPENQSNSSAQNIAYPAMSVRRNGGVVFYAGWKQDDMTSSTGPGDAEIIEATTTTGSDQTLVAYYDIQSTATDVTAGSIVVTGGASAISRTILLALRPLQTFTVERALNGVTQAIAAPQTVHVWRHGAVGL